MDTGTGLGVNGLRGTVARGDLNSGIVSEQRDDKDAVLHVFPSVWSSHEVVSAVVVGGDHACVGSIAVDAARGWAVPVDQFVVGDVAVDGGGAVLEGGDEGFGHVEPAVVGPERIISFSKRRVVC